MANRSETIIIDVQVTDVKKQLGETAKAINDLKEQNKALKKEQKDGTADWTESTATIKANEAQIKLLTAAEKSLTGQLNANETANRNYGKSNTELRAQVIALENAYNSLTDKQKDSTAGKALLARQNELKASVKSNAEELGNFQDSVGNYAKGTEGLADAFSQMPGVLGKAGGAIKGTTIGFQAMNAASPVGWIQIAIQVIAGLVQKFTSFAPVMDGITNGLAKLSAAFDVLKNGVIAVITGQKSLGEVLSGASGEMTKQVKEAERLAEAQRDLEDRTEASTISQEKYKNQVNQLLLQSKNRTLSEKQRMKLIDDALAIENKAYAERKKLADDEVKLLQDNIIKQGGFNKFEASELRKKGVAYARYKENQKNIDDQSIKDLAAALVTQQSIEGESISLREKAMNRRDQLEDKAVEEKEKRDAKNIKNAEDAEKARIDAINNYVQAELNRINEVATNAENKRLEALAKVQAAEDLLKSQTETLRGLATENADIELQAFNDLQFAKRVLADGNISEMARIDREALRAEYDAKIANAQAAGRDTAAIEAAFSEEKKRINQAENDAKLDIASQTMGSLSTIFGEGTKAGKAFAAAQVAIDTYKGALSAFTSMASIPFVGPVLGGIAAAGVVAKGVKSIKDIYAVKKGQTSVSAQAATPAISASSVSTPATKGADLVLNSSQAGSLNGKIAAGQPQSGGLDYDLLAKSMSKQPAPVMVYSEFKNFEGKVTNFDEQTKI